MSLCPCIVTKLPLGDSYRHQASKRVPSLQSPVAPLDEAEPVAFLGYTQLSHDGDKVNLGRARLLSQQCMAAVNRAAS